MARSVRDVALALDLVTGADAEDPVTADAAGHIAGSFAATLDAATLAGKRIGSFASALSASPESARSRPAWIAW